MQLDLTLLYVGLMTLLFFFWVYGIVSFALDLKNKIIPGVRQLLRNREVEQQEAEQERAREDRERQLY